MTINSTARTAGPFTGNGVTTVFPFSFKVFSRGDVLVAKTDTATSVETVMVLDSDYTVALSSDQNSSPGGNITMLVAPAIGTTLAATSNLSIVQPLDLTNGGGFYPSVINTALDRLTINIQQLAARVGLGALNVGAAATIATVLAFIGNLALGAGASLVGFIQDCIGAVKRAVQDKLRESLSVFDFMTEAQIADVRSRALTLDVTEPIQKAIAAAKLANEPLHFPRGWYKVTDTLMLSQGMALRGSSWFPADWRVPAMATTKIKLVTAAVKDLFNVDQSDLNQGYVWGINVANMMLEGSDVAGSRGLFLKKAASSVVENVGITKFGRGLEIEFGMMNEYNRVNSSECVEASFFINGNSVTTTQTFNGCVGRESPWAWILESTATGNSFGTIMNNCSMESTTEGGISAHRCCGFEFNNGYAENCPDDRVKVDGAIFHLWMDGDATVDPYRSVALIKGGDLAGGNFNSFTDSAIIEVGAGRSLLIDGSSMKRATYGIRWDASTADNAIQVMLPDFVQVANLYSGPTGKMKGFYPDGNLTTPYELVIAADQMGVSGVWTAALTSATGTITMDLATGAYLKKGKEITLTGLFTVASVAAPTGQLKLTGLPFPCASGFKNLTATTVSAWFLTGITTETVTSAINGGADYIEINKYTNGSPANMAQHITAGTEIRVCATYLTP